MPDYLLARDRTAGSTTATIAPIRTDVAVVGAGLAGSLAALMLARQGCDVALFDLHEGPLPEFRAEQLVGPQIGRLDELGVLSSMTQRSRLCLSTVNGQAGRLIDRTQVSQYGLPYHRMVEAARTSMPASVRRITARVATLDTSPDRQLVTVSDGRVVSARLLILATGLSTVLAKRLGITSTTIRAGHSLALGFDIALDQSAKISLLPMTYYSGQVSQKADYLALFPMEDVLRANLFSYQDRGSAWTQAFCAAPAEALSAAMPGLYDVIGPLRVTSAVQVRSNDLRVASDPVRDGVVLIGDAFQTPCPAAGTGIDRLLSDVTILCASYVPGWLATPGMEKTKIAAYYEDPTKRAFDAECLRIAHYRRAAATERSLGWAFHRQHIVLRRTLRAAVSRALSKTSQCQQTMAPSI